MAQRSAERYLRRRWARRSVPSVEVVTNHLPRLGFRAPSLTVVLVLLLAAGVTACGQDEEGPGRPHGRSATGLLQSADRLRPPMPKVLDTSSVDIARLDHDLRSALADAVRAARADGVRIEVTSSGCSTRPC